MTERRACIEGIAFWAPSLPSWDDAVHAFRGSPAVASPAARRPSPELLPPAERRRAPDSVALALEVATHAVRQSGRSPGDLLSVFTSAHGELSVTDYLCNMLVSAPLSISPTKFHNAVHNAASGYWGIATGCLQASTAVSAFDCSFAAGLLEALTQSAADARPVLLVGYDVAACGPLVSTNDSRGLLAVALVIAPEGSGRALFDLGWSLVPGPGTAPGPSSVAARSLAANAMADALPFFESLAIGGPASLTLRLSGTLSLQARLRPSA